MMRVLRILGMILFLVGAVVGLLDLLDVWNISKLNNPFYGALSLMILGISLTFFTQAKEAPR